MNTILLVDDDHFTRKHWSAFIKRRGVDVVAVETGQDAVAIFEKLRPDCVFLDMFLYDISGQEVLKQIKSIDPETIIYIFSGRLEEIPPQQLQEIGANGYFCKPVDYHILSKVVEQVRDIEKVTP